MGQQVLQEQDGRWRWAVGEMHEHGRGFNLACGAISFQTKLEAEEDMEIHLKAERNAVGRLVLPKAHVQRMVRAAAETCPSCTDTYFGGVAWQPPDEIGCNWTVSTMDGPSSACLVEIRAQAMLLRQLYSIPDES